jgi:hypothetical protein
MRKAMAINLRDVLKAGLPLIALFLLGSAGTLPIS